MRNEVTFAIRKAKSEEIDKLSNKLKDPSIRQKDWWKTLKSFIKPDQESVLPPLKSNAIFIVILNKKRRCSTISLHIIHF